MKRLLALLSIFAFGGVFGYGTATAAESGAIKVGILPPLTGTFAAVAETQRDGAQFAADAVALLKQVQQTGLNKEMTVFNGFITNVVAKGLPAFLVKGKGAKEQKHEWDLFTVVSSVGGESVLPTLKSLGY